MRLHDYAPRPAHIKWLPSRRSSFHTTICVLEGLLDYERAGRKSAAVTKARKRAENYLLERRMFRSLRRRM
jgi:hypothetical protein